jgi:hypothetical protein
MSFVANSTRCKMVSLSGVATASPFPTREAVRPYAQCRVRLRQLNHSVVSLQLALLPPQFLAFARTTTRQVAESQGPLVRKQWPRTAYRHASLFAAGVKMFSMQS